VTIEALPNTVLLEIFSFYTDPLRLDYDGWHALVHVCRRWRFVVFDSPRRLDLRLNCTPKRPLKMLDIWPALPIVIDFFARGKRPKGMANVIHCGSDFIFASVLCKIIDVMTLFSKVE